MYVSIWACMAYGELAQVGPESQSTCTIIVLRNEVHFKFRKLGKVYDFLEVLRKINRFCNEMLGADGLGSGTYL